MRTFTKMHDAGLMVRTRRLAALQSLLLAAVLPACLEDASSAQMVALVGGTVFTDPDARPLENAVVLIDGERIVEVGPKDRTLVPGAARVIDATGMSIMAGFWNTHVHFTESKWEDASSRDADALSASLSEMLLRWGFIRVVDTGSVLQNTEALRARIRKGEVTGPDIWTAGMPFAPPDANPFYVEPLQLPQLKSPGEVQEAVEAHFRTEADLLKVFSGSPVAPGRTVLMPVAALSEASGTAHARGGLVVAHPTTNDGVRVAIAGGVDILAHTTPDGGEPWSASLIAAMREAGMSVVPTLTLWRWSLEQQNMPDEDGMRLVRLAQEQVRDYAHAGGSILFGTDVGFITEYDPTREYVLLSEAGLPFSEILRALTTEPSRVFGVEDAGTVSPGGSADLVIVKGRPDRDILALADVVAVYLRGRQVFER